MSIVKIYPNALENAGLTSWCEFNCCGRRQCQYCSWKDKKVTILYVNTTNIIGDISNSGEGDTRMTL